MQIVRDTAGSNQVLGYRPGELRLAGGHYTVSVALAAEAMHAPWQHGPPEALTLEELGPVLALGGEILVLGTGQRQVFPPPELYAALAERGIGLEVMDNSAACRTFNVLLSERRSALLALMLDPGDSA